MVWPHRVNYFMGDTQFVQCNVRMCLRNVLVGDFEILTSKKLVSVLVLLKVLIKDIMRF